MQRKQQPHLRLTHTSDHTSLLGHGHTAVACPTPTNMLVTQLAMLAWPVSHEQQQLDALPGWICTPAEAAPPCLLNTRASAMYPD